jgi:hypothetical protein
MSAVVYARVPDSLKQSLHAHAAERGLSLTTAVVGLVERGLEAIADEPAVTELERTLAAATSELAQTRERLKNAELGLQAAQEREQLTAQTYSALAEALAPRCWYRSESQTSSETSTSRFSEPSASSSAWRSPQPIRARIDTPAAALPPRVTQCERDVRPKPHTSPLTEPKTR